MPACDDGVDTVAPKTRDDLQRLFGGEPLEQMSIDRVYEFDRLLSAMMARLAIHHVRQALAEMEAAERLLSGFEDAPRLPKGSTS